MKVILVALGVLFSLQVCAQNTVTYTYDSAGNRVARSAPASGVASASTSTANRAANQTDFALLLRKSDGEGTAMTASANDKTNMASAAPIQFWNGQLNCLVAPAEPARANGIVLPATIEKRKNLIETLD